MLVLDWNIWNHTTVCKLFVLDWNTQYHMTVQKSAQKCKYKCTVNTIP